MVTRCAKGCSRHYDYYIVANRREINRRSTSLALFIALFVCGSLWARDLRNPVRDAAVQANPQAVQPTPGDENWDSQFSPRGVAFNAICTNVNAMVWGGSRLYAAGQFTTAGGTIANNIAMWDGQSWNPLGSGTDGTINALAWDGTNLYAGGVFRVAGGVSANFVAKWNGSTWSPLGSGLGWTVESLVWDGYNLIAGGDFHTAGGVAADYIARWNGSVWSGLGSGMNKEVRALTWDGHNLYAGGAFTTAGGVAANYVARWNGSGWSGLGSGMDYLVRALTWDGRNLYAAGYFTTAGGLAAKGIARWNGSSWSAMGSQANNVTALLWNGVNLVAAGNLRIAGSPVDGIFQWNGTSWSTLGSIALDNGGPFVAALVSDGLSLYAGGLFASVNGIGANSIAKWNGSQWIELPPSGSGVNAGINAFAWDGTNLYAGGILEAAGGTQAKYVAKWNGASWAPLGSGTGQAVEALVRAGSTLYAGGIFGIAGWNGSGWGSSATWPAGNTVSALAWDGRNLYAGGTFSTMGGVAASNVAIWNVGTHNWRALGSGMDGDVDAFAWDGTYLYAGGNFTTAGGVSSSNIARWDGVAWSPLDSGVNGPIYCLLWDGTNIYAAGHFTIAGGQSANNIAMWNGSNWSALGSGTDLAIYALAWDGSHLFAGGDFLTAGGQSANHVGEWSNGSWSPLGSGMATLYDTVTALAWDGNTLYTGGWFTIAGNKPSNMIARWSVPGCNAPNIGLQPRSFGIPKGESTELNVVAYGSAPLSYQWYQGLSGDTSSPIAGASTDIYTTPRLTTSSSFWVRISNGCGTLDSKTASISVPPYYFHDDFSDLDSSDWTPTKGSWSASSGELVGTSKKNADDISPVFACTYCTIEVDMRIITPGAKASILGWYATKKVYVELTFLQDHGTIRLQQHGEGHGNAKQSISYPIEMGQTYHVKLSYDSLGFHVLINGSGVMDISTQHAPNGRLGARIASTTDHPSSVSLDNWNVY